MGCIGFGKTSEGILVTAAFKSERIKSATVYFNGQSITFGSGIGFDTQPFDDCLCAVNVGTIEGALASVASSIYECATDNPSAATALSGAAFTTLNSTTDERLQTGSVKCKNTQRYLFLRTETQGQPLTVDYGAVWIGGTARQQITHQALEFDI